MSRFLLLVPRSISPKGTIPRIHLPLGALAIASQAKKDGHIVKLLDTSIGKVDEKTRDSYFEMYSTVVVFDGIEYWRTGMSDMQIVDEVRLFKPDVMAISCLTVVDREDTKYLCRLLKTHFPDIPLFLGGHEISHNYQDVLIKKIERNYIPDIEGISIGLGQPFIDGILRYLIQKKNGNKTVPPKEFAFLENGHIILSQSEKMDPNNYALFDYSLLQSVQVSGREKPYDVYSFIGNTHAGNISELLNFKERPLSYFPIFTSYGCGNNCTFCDTDQYLLRYSVENVKKMIDQYEDLYGIDYIDFMDNNFAGGDKISREICFNILEYIHNKGYKIGFSNGLTFESMMRNNFELLRCFEKHDNVVHIAFPCENGNARVLKMIRKPHTVEMIKETLSFAREHLSNVNREGFFIGGFPKTLGQDAETPEEVRNTVEFIRNILQNNLLNQAIFLKLSPVTSIYREMWEEKHSEKSFVHCLFSKGTDIWPYDNSLLEEARVEVMKINITENRFVTRKL
jgi:radical SAM superfamily enzyme YgiQ (UPF0313 family)